MLRYAARDTRRQPDATQGRERRQIAGRTLQEVTCAEEREEDARLVDCRTSPEVALSWDIRRERRNPRVPRRRQNPTSHEEGALGSKKRGYPLITSERDQSQPSHREALRKSTSHCDSFSAPPAR